MKERRLIFLDVPLTLIEEALIVVRELERMGPKQKQLGATMTSGNSYYAIRNKASITVRPCQ